MTALHAEIFMFSSIRCQPCRARSVAFFSSVIAFEVPHTSRQLQVAKRSCSWHCKRCHFVPDGDFEVAAWFSADACARNGFDKRDSSAFFMLQRERSQLCLGKLISGHRFVSELDFYTSWRNNHYTFIVANQTIFTQFLELLHFHGLTDSTVRPYIWYKTQYLCAEILF